MQDVELYPLMSGLAPPCSVPALPLDVEVKCTEVHMQHAEENRWRFPGCERTLSCYDHAPGRSQQGLHTCQFGMLLTARIPRGHRPEQSVLQVAMPRGGTHARFTLLRERLVIHVLAACQTVPVARRIGSLIWNEVQHPMRLAVQRDLKRKAAGRPSDGS